MSLKNPVTPPGIDPGTVRLVAQCLNHYAAPGPIYIYIYLYIYLFIYLPVFMVCLRKFSVNLDKDITKCKKIGEEMNWQDI